MKRATAQWQWALVFACVLMIVALAGCGGGKTAALLLTPVPIEGLPAGHTLRTGTIRAGEDRTVREADGVRTVVACPAGGAACEVTVAADGAAESTGGALTVTTYTALALPAGHTLRTGTIRAGEDRTVREADGVRTVVACPAGGAACEVTVAADGAAESTGGALTVTTYTALALPAGHTLRTGTIRAGEDRTVREADGVRTVVACPAGGAACEVTVAADGAAESTGGALTVTTYTALALPAGHTLRTGTIRAGEDRTVREADGVRTVVACPAGGAACEVTVAADGAAESTGGALTVTTYTALALPAGHTLRTGTIRAGEDRTVREADGVRTVVACPAGGAACEVTVAADGAAESTGGALTVTTYTALALPAGHTLRTGTIRAGEDRTVREADGVRTVVACPAGGAACEVTVAADGAAESTGGALTVTTYTALALPAGHTLRTGTIRAGEDRTVREADGVRTVVACPAGGAACEVTVAADGAAESTGGALTVTTYTALALPAGHTLRTGTIRAGEDRTVREADGVRTVVACPAGGAACEVTVAADGAAESTGGALTVTTYTALALPAGHTLRTGTIRAGEDRTVREADGVRTVVACPAGGAACEVTVAADGAAESTGGALTVTTYTALALPAGHTLRTGTIRAGEDRTVREADGVRTVVACPAGGAACEVTVAADGAAESTGGALTVTTYTALALPAGHTLRTGTIRAGEDRTVREADGVRTVVACPAGGAACEVTVAADGAAESTGGALTVATYTPIDLPSGHTLVSGTTIPPGETLTVWSDGNVGTLVTCPADGKACVFRVVDGAAEYTGGTPTVVTEITGLSGHTLTAGTTIPAGVSRSAVYSRGRGANVACPAGGEDCLVVWVSDSIAEFEGGMPTLTVVNNEMVWQANNGPDGTSDGGHARGLEGRIQFGNFLDDFFRLTNNGVATRVGVNAQGSPDPDPTVTPSVEWTRGASPRLGLTLGAAAVSSLDLSALGPNLGRLSVDRGSTIPSLGTGWNGVALTRRYANARADATGGKTVHAVLYSNIERPVGGTPDGHYLLLGSWLTMPDDSGAASTEYDWAVFADGNPASRLTLAQVRALTGTVQYEGPATGLYLMSTYTGSGFSRPLTGSKVGSFTATARVTADFGTSSTIGSFGGSVANFMENGESLGDWEVTMPATMTTISGNDVLYVGATAGTTGTSNLTGSWSVQFYSDGATDGGWAAGTFTAATAANNNEGLRITGSYGATKQ